jgi:hypothetical protein
MTDTSRLLRALLRQDLLAFIQRMFRDLDPGTAFVMGWHYQAIAARGPRHDRDFPA